MKKILLHVSKKLLIGGAIALISILAYSKWTEPTVVYNETVTTQALKGSVYTSKMAFEQARQIGKIFGYENMWNFNYKLDQSPEFIKKSANENWVSNSAKSVGHFLLGKEYSIDLNNYFMLGYDFSTLQTEDVRYIEESRTVIIQLPALELSYTPDYAETAFDSSVGLLRLGFSEEEQQKMYQDSIETGIDAFTEEAEEIEKGELYTQESIQKLLFAIPTLSEHVNTIEFVRISDEIVTSIEEYKKAANTTNH